MDKKIKKTEASIQKLSAHAEKKTCPKDLRYNVRVNITSDQEFKSGISRIRREAKQKLVAALISYHHRRAEKDKIKLKSVQKTHKNSEKGKTDNPELIKNRPRPVPEKESTENVLFLANERAVKFKRLKEMMKALQNKESESYSCVSTDSLVKVREKVKVLGENCVKQHLLSDLKQFARRMRLRYISHDSS